MKNLNKVFMVMMVVMAIFAFASCDNAADSSTSTDSNTSTGGGSTSTTTLSAGTYYVAGATSGSSIVLASDGTLTYNGIAGSWTQTSMTLAGVELSMTINSSTSFTTGGVTYNKQ